MPSEPSPTTQAPPAPNGTVTLNCPHCGAALRTAAETSVEGPCPICGTTIKYVSPHRTEPVTFVPLPTPRNNPAEPEFEKPRPQAVPRPKKLLSRRTRQWIRIADEFFYSRTGRALSCAVLAVLVFYSVVLFFKWDKRRRAQAAEQTPPPAIKTIPETPADP